MGSFVSLPDPATATDDPAAAAPVVNDGFFPDIDLTAIRDIGRIGTVTNARLRASVIAAIITVARDLDAWANTQKAAGFATLAAVPAVQIDGASRLVHLYHRAVAMFAKAELVERMSDYDTTGAGGKKIDELGDATDDLRRDGTHAVRDMLGRLRTNVELI